MKRRLATLAAVSMFALVLGATPAMAAGSPLTRVTFPAAEMGSACGYEFTDGTIVDTFRTADAVVDPDTGELLYVPAAHMTLHHVRAVQNDVSYRVIGTEIYSDLKGHLTAHLVFVGPDGGIADSLRVVIRAYANGDFRVFQNAGSCTGF
jgi:hypothetical protein